MSCASVRKSISEFLDRSLIEEERISIARHLDGCRDCAGYFEQMNRTHSMVRELPAVETPAPLVAKLRVLASHERERRLRHRSIPILARHMAGRLSLFTDNLMRPLALPAAGGLLSAMFLMCMLVSTLGFRLNVHNDVPTPFYTEATLGEMAPFGFDHDEVVVELTINEKGFITEVSLPNCPDKPKDAEIINMMLFSRFNPATLFGQPMSGKVRLELRKNSIVVRG